MFEHAVGVDAPQVGVDKRVGGAPGVGRVHSDGLEQGGRGGRHRRSRHAHRQLLGDVEAGVGGHGRGRYSPAGRGGRGVRTRGTDTEHDLAGRTPGSRMLPLPTRRPRPRQSFARAQSAASATTRSGSTQASHGDQVSVVSSLAETMWPSSPGKKRRRLPNRRAPGRASWFVPSRPRSPRSCPRPCRQPAGCLSR